MGHMLGDFGGKRVDFRVYFCRCRGRRHYDMREVEVRGECAKEGEEAKSGK